MLHVARSSCPPPEVFLQDDDGWGLAGRKGVGRMTFKGHAFFSSVGLALFNSIMPSPSDGIVMKDNN